MSTRLIVFRTDASREIGTGHVMRCMTLAGALKEQGDSVEFLCREHDGNLCDLLEARGFVVRRLAADTAGEGDFAGFGQQAGFSPELPGENLLPDQSRPDGGAAGANKAPGVAHARWLGCDWTQDAAQSVAAIAGMARRPAWLIVDHYALDFRWERVLRTQVSRVMVIDDLADRQHDCDLLLDQNLVPEMTTRYAQRVPVHCTCLLGPHYALLQAQYADMRAQRKQRHDPPRRLFAYFGGFDPANLGGMTVEAFLALVKGTAEGQTAETATTAATAATTTAAEAGVAEPAAAAASAPDLQLDLVLPANSVHNFAIQKLAQQHANIHLYSQLPSLAPLMAAADLALGAGGATTWERMCLGLPSLIVTVAENQRESAMAQQAQGLVHVLGHVGEVDRSVILAALQRVLTEGVAALVPADLGNVVDGQGVARVLAAMQEQLPQTLQAHLLKRQQAAQENDTAPPNGRT